VSLCATRSSATGARVPSEIVGYFTCMIASAFLCGSTIPGHQREAQVRDPVDRLQTRHVVLLDLDTARPQLGEFSGQVVHPPAGLSLLVSRARGALSDRQLAVPAALVGDLLVTLVQNLEAELAGIELLGRLQVGGQQDNVDRMLCQHALPSLPSEPRLASSDETTPLRSGPDTRDCREARAAQRAAQPGPALLLGAKVSSGSLVLEPLGAAGQIRPKR
jgi:hypothetical protein